MRVFFCHKQMLNQHRQIADRATLNIVGFLVEYRQSGQRGSETALARLALLLSAHILAGPFADDSNTVVQRMFTSKHSINTSSAVDSLHFVTLATESQHLATFPTRVLTRINRWFSPTCFLL